MRAVVHCKMSGGSERNASTMADIANILRKLANEVDSSSHSNVPDRTVWTSGSQGHNVNAVDGKNSCLTLFLNVVYLYANMFLFTYDVCQYYDIFFDM